MIVHAYHSTLLWFVGVLQAFKVLDAEITTIATLVIGTCMYGPVQSRTALFRLETFSERSPTF